MTTEVEQTENWDAPERDSEVAYPEYPANPHNHRYTLSYDPQKPPFLVVRANTVNELTEAFQELEDGGVYAAMGNAWRVMKAQASVGAGLGPTTPVAAPAGPPAPPAMPQAPQFPQPAQQFPGAPGTAPAAWQNTGAPTPPAPPQGGANGNGRNGPKPRPTDWAQVYRITVPRGDDSFKAYREENQQYFKGKIRFAGNGSYWVEGSVAQSLATWNPVPA